MMAELSTADKANKFMSHTEDSANLAELLAKVQALVDIAVNNNVEHTSTAATSAWRDAVTQLATTGSGISTLTLSVAHASNAPQLKHWMQTHHVPETIARQSRTLDGIKLVFDTPTRQKALQSAQKAFKGAVEAINQFINDKTVAVSGGASYSNPYTRAASSQPSSASASASASCSSGSSGVDEIISVEVPDSTANGNYNFKTGHVWYPANKGEKATFGSTTSTASAMKIYNESRGAPPPSVLAQAQAQKSAAAPAPAPASTGGFCGNCGTKKEGGKFCGGCGAKL